MHGSLQMRAFQDQIDQSVQPKIHSLISSVETFVSRSKYIGHCCFLLGQFSPSGGEKLRSVLHFINDQGCWVAAKKLAWVVLRLRSLTRYIQGDIMIGWE